MTAKKSSKPSAPPATVLTITLNPDGTGSLLARRGELAHLSQFTYRNMAEIVAALQHGATELITVEQNPPVLDVPSAQPSANEQDHEAESVPESAEEVNAADEPSVEEADADSPSAIAPTDVMGVTIPSPVPQPKLL